MLLIKNMRPGIKNNKILSGEPWSFEALDWREDYDYDVFISNEDTHQEISGFSFPKDFISTLTVKGEDDNYEVVKLTSKISGTNYGYNGSVYNNKNLKLKIEYSIENTLSVEKSGLYSFSFPQQLKFLLLWQNVYSNRKKNMYLCTQETSLEENSPISDYLISTPFSFDFLLQDQSNNKINFFSEGQHKGYLDNSKTYTYKLIVKFEVLDLWCYKYYIEDNDTNTTDDFWSKNFVENFPLETSKDNNMVTYISKISFNNIESKLLKKDTAADTSASTYYRPGNLVFFPPSITCFYNLEYEKFETKKDGLSFNLPSDSKLTEGTYYINIKNNKDVYLKQSLVESYEIITKPEIDVMWSEDLDTGEVSIDFSYNKGNKYPKLWHRIQINNIDENRKKIPIYDSKKVYSAIPEFCFSYDLFLPNEEYEIIVSAADTNNVEVEWRTSHNTDGNGDFEVNFNKKEINFKTSESFIKISCKDLGYKQDVFPSNILYPQTSLYPSFFFKKKDFITTKILRQDLTNNHATWVATISAKEANQKNEIKIYDYGAKANVPYNYWIYGNFASVSIEDDDITLWPSSDQGIKLNDEPIIAEWDRWTLITADKDPENEKIYHVDKVFTFEMNLSSGSMTNGTNITTSKNFTEFPVVQKDKSNFYSGSLTALMGVRKWGSTAEDFEQTPHMLEELRQLSTNYQPKFLKDRSGHLWQVEINGAIQVDNTDNLATIDLKTMTVPWVQIGEADDISLIYTGTEKKEDLYC